MPLHPLVYIGTSAATSEAWVVFPPSDGCRGEGVCIQKELLPNALVCAFSGILSHAPQASCVGNFMLADQLT